MLVYLEKDHFVLEQANEMKKIKGEYSGVQSGVENLSKNFFAALGTCGPLETSAASPAA